MKELTYVIGTEDAGKPVKRIVRGVMGVSHKQFASAKVRQQVLRNGEPVYADVIVSGGDVISLIMDDPEYRKDGFEVIAEDLPVNVVYEDEDILIIDKQAPLPCQCGVRQPGGTLENRMAARYPNLPFRPVNRLDKGTSGLMAAAKQPHAQMILQKQLHTPQFVRRYLAVLDGELTGVDVVDRPIAKADGATVRREISKSGKPAVTHVLETTVCYEKNRTLALMQLETGRTHQIRVHMSSLGTPVYGDFLYGTEKEDLPGRFALHSAYIEFVHPTTREKLAFTSPLPDELQRLL